MTSSRKLFHVIRVIIIFFWKQEWLFLSSLLCLINRNYPIVKNLRFYMLFEKINEFIIEI